MSLAKTNVRDMIRDQKIEFTDLRFTDTRGQLKHVTLDTGKIDESFFTVGEMFDGSSVAGWKSINNSDMKLMPDPDSALVDPFAERPTICIYCDVVDPNTGLHYDKDPRSVAKKAEAFLKSTGVGDTCFMGPEAEFFLFNDVRYRVGSQSSFYEVDGRDASWGSSRKIDSGNCLLYTSDAADE